MNLFTEKLLPLTGYGLLAISCIAIYQALELLMNRLMPFGWYLLF